MENYFSKFEHIGEFKIKNLKSHSISKIELLPRKSSKGLKTRNDS